MTIIQNSNICSIKKRQFWLIISIKINQLIVDLNFNGDNYSNICMNQCVAWCRHWVYFELLQERKEKRKVPGIRLFMSVRLNLYGERSILHLLQHSKTKNNNLSSNAIFQRRCTMVHLLLSAKMATFRWIFDLSRSTVNCAP